MTLVLSISTRHMFITNSVHCMRVQHKFLKKSFALRKAASPTVKPVNPVFDVVNYSPFIRPAAITMCLYHNVIGCLRQGIMKCSLLGLS